MAINGTGISFSGLASGIDSGALIQKLVTLEGLPIKLLEAKKETFQDKLSTLGTFKGLVKDLQTKAKTLATKSDFLSFKASASLEGFLSVSASGAATEGVHTVTVNKLAAVDRWAFDGVASKTANLATVDGQQLSFSVGGTNISVTTVANDSSLEQIAADINSAAQGKVTASVVNAGTSASPSYQLVLTSTESGAANRITGLTNNIAGLNINTAGPNGAGVAQSPNNITVGSDAEAVIDGLTIVREDNDFGDVITGLDLKLQAADPAKTITVAVDPNTEVIKTKLKDFVDTYNKLIEFVNKQNSYNQEAGAGGDLFGDSILKSVMGDIRQALFGVSQTTVANDTEGYSMLSLVGIKSKTNGTLEIDNTKLDSKLATNIDAFADLFADLDGFSNGGAAQNTPAYYTDITADSGLAASLDRAIDKMMKTYTGQGGNVLKGIFDTRTETYNNSISKLSKDIAAKEAQVAKFQETLVARFTKLEEVMGGLNSQGASLQAALTGLM